MTDWLDLVRDSHGVRAVYGACPSLTGITLAEVSVRPDGRRATIRFDLPEFPADPPAAWRAARHNTVQLTLTFEATDHVTFTGPITDDAAELVLADDGDHVTGQLTAPSFTLAVRSRWLMFGKMSPYQRLTTETDT